MTRKPFFTWVSDDWKHPADVPQPVIDMMRVLWSDGVTKDRLAEIFQVPIEWVEIFVRSDTGETILH